MKNFIKLLLFPIIINAQINDTIAIRDEKNIGEIVVSGTLKPISRLNTPVPVEIYNKAFFKKIQLLIYLKRYKILMVLGRN